MMKRLEEEARTGRAENPFGDVSKSNNSMGDINPGNGSSMSAPVNIANQSDAIEMVEQKPLVPEGAIEGNADQVLASPRD